MTEIVPHGYISVREAGNHLGPELFPEAWTGKEHAARRGLISEEEWLKIKDLAPARRGGALGTALLPTTFAASAATALHSTRDPSSSSYQAEYRARKRYENSSFAHCLKLAISKQPSWILLLGSCIEPRLHCGVGVFTVKWFRADRRHLTSRECIARFPRVLRCARDARGW
jgi:hypothetical protein